MDHWSLHWTKPLANPPGSAQHHGPLVSPLDQATGQSTRVHSTSRTIGLSTGPSHWPIHQGPLNITDHWSLHWTKPLANPPGSAQHHGPLVSPLDQATSQSTRVRSTSRTTGLSTGPSHWPIHQGPLNITDHWSLSPLDQATGQ